MTTAIFLDGLRHPVRTLRSHWPHPALNGSTRSETAPRVPGDGAQSADRLERISAYARSGYFHVEYTAGMFVVPLDVPNE